MFGTINPQSEQFRAQSIVRSLTEYRKAVNVFSPEKAQPDTVEAAEITERPEGQFSFRMVFRHD